MEILGSIQSDGVEVGEREKMQRHMRDFIARVHKGRRWETRNVVYKVHFWKPIFSSKVDSLIEFRADGYEAWYARANGADSWKSFFRALASLKQIVTEMEMREEGANAHDDNGAA